VNLMVSSLLVMLVKSRVNSYIGLHTVFHVSFTLTILSRLLFLLILSSFLHLFLYGLEFHRKYFCCALFLAHRRLGQIIHTACNVTILTF
jgi:hypothetical protein